jgi:hypothetical protein
MITLLITGVPTVLAALGVKGVVSFAPDNPHIFQMVIRRGFQLKGCAIGLIKMQEPREGGEEAGLDVEGWVCGYVSHFDLRCLVHFFCSNREQSERASTPYYAVD